MTQDKCQGCAVQQGYVPVGAVAQIQDASRLPEIKDMLNSPQTLNNNDRAFWVLGWNECRDAAKSLIAHIAELEAQLAAVQQGVPLFYFNPSDAKNYQNAQGRFDCGALPVSKKPCSYYTSPLYTNPTQQGLDAQALSKSFREYLTVSEHIDAPGNAMDSIATDLTRIVLAEAEVSAVIARRNHCNASGQAGEDAANIRAAALAAQAKQGA
ncbi:MAG: hypothetical protein ITG01_03920 [Comamonas sp.]|nr:hypothetical protein [Comamonas sp.]